MAKRVNDDAPEITPEMFAQMRPMKDVAPDLVRAHKKARGRPKLDNPKVVVSVRLSASGKRAWDALPTGERAKLIAAMERGAIKSASR